MSRPVLLVTGGSRGIGAAICVMAAQRGYDVAVNYQSAAKAAAEVVAACEAAGAKAVALQGDMAREEDITRVFEAAKEALGPLTHVVNNAGITGRASPLAQADAAVIRTCIDVNVTGAILVAREAARALIANGTARAGRSSTFLRSRPRSAVPANMSGMPPPRARSTASRSDCRRSWRPASASMRSRPASQRPIFTASRPATPPVSDASPRWCRCSAPRPPRKSPRQCFFCSPMRRPM